MAWFFLIVAGLFEVGFASSLMKVTETSGWTALGWFISFALSLSAGMWFLYLAMRDIPMGTSYAVFAGVGAVGTVVAGILIFDEPMSFWRLFFLGTLISSIVGLNLVGS